MISWSSQKPFAKTLALSGGGISFALLLALIIRVIGDLACGIWYDEVFSIKIAAKSWSTIPQFIAKDVHPGGYYYWLKLFLCGAKEGSLALWPVGFLRLSSLLPEMLILWILADWSRKRWGQNAAVTLTLAGALNAGLIYYSIEIRSYALGMLLVLCSVILLECALTSSSRVTWLKYGLCCLCLMQTHYLTWLIILVQCVFIAWYLLKCRDWGRSYSYPLLISMVVMGIMLMQAPEALQKHRLIYQANSQYFHETQLTDIVTVFSYDFTGFVYGLPVFGKFGSTIQVCWGVFYGLLAWCAFASKSGSCVNRQNERLMNQLLVWNVCCYLGLLWLISLVPWSALVPGMGPMKLFSGYRTAMFVLPLWLMLLGMQIEIRASSKGLLRIGLVVLMIPGCIWGLWSRYKHLDDLGMLTEHIEHPADCNRSHLGYEFYVEDQALYPWLSSIEGRLRLQSLDEKLRCDQQVTAPLQILTHTASDLNLRDQRDQRRIQYIRDWTATHGNPTEKVGVIEINILPSSQYAEFRAGFLQILAKASPSHV